MPPRYTLSRACPRLVSSESYVVISCPPAQRLLSADIRPSRWSASGWSRLLRLAKAALKTETVDTSQLWSSGTRSTYAAAQSTQFTWGVVAAAAVQAA